jgi:hypothetical protein
MRRSKAYRDKQHGREDEVLQAKEGALKEPLDRTAWRSRKTPEQKAVGRARRRHYLARIAEAKERGAAQVLGKQEYSKNLRGIVQEVKSRIGSDAFRDWKPGERDGVGTLDQHGQLHHWIAGQEDAPNARPTFRISHDGTIDITTRGDVHRPDWDTVAKAIEQDPRLKPPHESWFKEPEFQRALVRAKDAESLRAETDETVDFFARARSERISASRELSKARMMHRNETGIHRTEPAKNTASSQRPNTSITEDDALPETAVRQVISTRGALKPRGEDELAPHEHAVARLDEAEVRMADAAAVFKRADKMMRRLADKHAGRRARGLTAVDLPEEQVHRMIGDLQQQLVSLEKAAAQAEDDAVILKGVEHAREMILEEIRVLEEGRSSRVRLKTGKTRMHYFNGEGPRKRKSRGSKGSGKSRPPISGGAGIPKNTHEVTFGDKTHTRKSEHEYPYASMKDGRVVWHKTLDAAKRRGGTIKETTVKGKRKVEGAKATGKTRIPPKPTPRPTPAAKAKMDHADLDDLREHIPHLEKQLAEAQSEHRVWLFHNVTLPFGGARHNLAASGEMHLRGLEDKVEKAQKALKGAQEYETELRAAAGLPEVKVTHKGKTYRTHDEVQRAFAMRDLNEGTRDKLQAGLRELREGKTPPPAAAPKPKPKPLGEINKENRAKFMDFGDGYQVEPRGDKRAVTKDGKTLAVVDDLSAAMRFLSEHKVKVDPDAKVAGISLKDELAYHDESLSFEVIDNQFPKLPEAQKRAMARVRYQSSSSEDGIVPKFEKPYHDGILAVFIRGQRLDIDPEGRVRAFRATKSGKDEWTMHHASSDHPEANTETAKTDAARQEFIDKRPKPSADSPEPTVDELTKNLKPGKPGFSVESEFKTRRYRDGKQAGFGEELPRSKVVVWRDKHGKPQGALRMTLDDKGQPEILEVAVAPVHQKSGIGSALFKKAEAEGYDVEKASGAGGLTEAGAALKHKRLTGKKATAEKQLPKRPVKGATAGDTAAGRRAFNESYKTRLETQLAAAEEKLDFARKARKGTVRLETEVGKLRSELLKVNEELRIPRTPLRPEGPPSRQARVAAEKELEGMEKGPDGIIRHVKELEPTDELPHQGFVWAAARPTGKAISGVAKTRKEAEAEVESAAEALGGKKGGGKAPEPVDVEPGRPSHVVRTIHAAEHSRHLADLDRLPARQMAKLERARARLMTTERELQEAVEAKRGAPRTRLTLVDEETGKPYADAVKGKARHSPAELTDETSKTMVSQMEKELDDARQQLLDAGFTVGDVKDLGLDINYAPHTRPPLTKRSVRRRRSRGANNPHTLPRTDPRPIHENLHEQRVRAADKGEDLPPEMERFSRDPGYLVGEYVQRAGRAIADAKFLQTLKEIGTPFTRDTPLREDIDSVYAIRKTGIKELSLAEKTAIIEGKPIHEGEAVVLPKVIGDPEVQVRVPKDHNAPYNQVTRIADRWLGQWKQWVTVMNVPYYQQRNLIDDSLRAWMADTDIRSFFTSARLMHAQIRKERGEKTLIPGTRRGKGAVDVLFPPGTSRGTTKLGPYGRVSDETLLDWAERYGAIRGGEVAGEINEMVGRMVGKEDKSPVRVIREGTINLEDVPRMASFVSALKRGMTKDEAGSWVRLHHFDYTELTEYERWLRRVIPFYTFTARNTRLQIQKQITRPGKFSQVELLREELAKLAGLPPDWDQNVSEVKQRAVPFAIPTGGKPKVIAPNLSLSDMNRNLFAAIASGQSVPDALNQQGDLTVSMLSPLLKIPAEVHQNHSFFFREAIHRTDDEPDAPHWVPAPPGVMSLPKPLRDFLGVIPDYRDPKTGKPVVAWSTWTDYAVRVLPQGGFASDVGTPSKNRRGESVKDRWIGRGTGLRQSDYNPKERRAEVVARQIGHAQAKQNDFRDRGRDSDKKHTAKGETPRIYSKGYETALDTEARLKQERDRLTGGYQIRPRLQRRPLTQAQERAKARKDLKKYRRPGQQARDQKAARERRDQAARILRDRQKHK